MNTMSPRKKLLVPVSRRRMAKAGDDLFPFNLLPVECQLHVLSFLSEVDKCNSALVCFSWSCLVRSGKLWRVADFSHHRVLNLRQEGLLVSNREFWALEGMVSPLHPPPHILWCKPTHPKSQLWPGGPMQQVGGASLWPSKKCPLQGSPPTGIELDIHTTGATGPAGWLHFPPQQHYQDHDGPVH